MGENCDDIQRACRLGDLELLVESLLTYPAGLNETDLKLGWTGLYRSVICGHVLTTEHLLKVGADPNIRTRMGDTALHQAAENRQYKIAALLLIYDADPNIQQNDGETALHLACFKGDEEMVHLLLSHKADPNIQNNIFGKSPLHYAVDYSYTKIINLLLQFNANPDLQDKHEKSPKDIARTVEVQTLLGANTFYLPSSEPSEIPQKTSIDFISPILSRRNSDISFTSDCKSVENKVKQLEDIHKKIRETVRASVDTAKVVMFSQNASSIFEPDAEKTGYDIIVDRKKPVSFGTVDKSPELYSWLCKKKLEECYGLLIAAGYDDLQQLSAQMKSKMPITEQSLLEIGVAKQGYRKRLMLALDDLCFKGPHTARNSNMSFFKCCTVEVPQNLLMLNMPGLDKWLESLNLKNLHSIFTEAGYDDLDQMLYLMNSPWEIIAEDLIEIGIDKPGYRHRILSKLKEDSWGLENRFHDNKLEKSPRVSPFTVSELCNIM